MKTVSVEMLKKETGELSYVVANMNVADGREKDFLVSKFIRERIAERGVIPTGNIFIAAPLSDKSTWTWHTAPVEGTKIETSEFDVLTEQYFALAEALKAKEKELVSLLNSAPGHQIEGVEYGGFNEYTTSTSLAYAQLYDRAKQELLKINTQESKIVLGILFAMEQGMTTPHKGSSKTFKVFKLGDKSESEFNKVWRE